MQYTFTDRLRSAWNAFTSRDPTYNPSLYYGTSYRPDRRNSYITNDGSIIEMIKNRIAVDVAQVNIRHVRKDDDGNYKDDMKSALNEIFQNAANVDQTGRAFIQDLVQSMFDEGCVAAVPIDTDDDPDTTQSYKILSIRVGQIMEWYPYSVKVRVFNELTARKQDIVVPKSQVAIVENPFYSIMNAPNSTLQRLTRTLRNLDIINDQNASGKMDLIIQLPYSLKSPLKQQQAESRRKQVEMQLVGSKYGIAYIDAAERITQLNRPVENNLWKEAQDLTAMLFNQLGLTQAIFDGTADENAMTNYYNRTVEPILAAIAEEMERKFLSPTARTQKQAIMYVRDPFKLVSVTDIAQIAQTFVSNEIMTSNEMRAKIGLKPVDTERANELINKQINKIDEGYYTEYDSEIQNDGQEDEYSQYLQDLDDLDTQLDELEAELETDEDEIKHYASPYYDPVKAHQYYEEHKKLKGRTSTAGLNEAGKEAAMYVKKQLKDERISKVDEKRNIKNKTVENKNNTMKRSVEQHKKTMQAKIDQLKAKLKAMSKSDRKANKETVKKQIALLREDNKKKRLQLREEFKSERSGLNERFKSDRTALKEEYDNKYVNELDRIRSESQYQKQKKSRR